LDIVASPFFTLGWHSFAPSEQQRGGEKKHAFKARQDWHTTESFQN
jgi:hypothetical protein